MSLRILITGASGFVGRHLVAMLQSALPAAEILPTSRRDGVVIAGLDTFKLDLEAPQEIRALLKDLKPDIIVNLAAEASGKRALADPMSAWRANFWNAVELAEAVRLYLPDGTLISISSSEIYGLSANHHAAIPEEAPFAPTGPYGATKAAADLAIGEMEFRGLRAIRLRPFNHIGPGQRTDFVVASFASQLALIEAGLQEPVIRTGRLDVRRDFLDVRDVCSAYIQVIRALDRIKPGTAINICSGHAVSARQILDYLISLSTAAITVETEAGRVRPNDVLSVSGDPSRARDLLDWHPTISLRQTLEDVLAWWRLEIRNLSSGRPTGRLDDGQAHGSHRVRVS
jgi:GDP-4-dehydro-6-deoxy-D-mannose reductase